MERRVAFVLVGLFSLILIGGIVGFILWSHTKTEEGKARNSYAIYFDQAVNGLSAGSSVRYLGVEAGQVQSIALDPTSIPPRVRVVVGIDGNIPITSGDIATIKPSGITGVSFIDLRHDGESQTTPLRPTDGPTDGKIPEIRSEPSDIDRILSSGTTTARHINEVLEKTNRLFDEQNMDHLATTLAHLSKATEKLELILTDIQKSGLERDLSQTLQDSRRAVNGVSDTLTSGRDAANNVSDLAKSLRDNPSRILYPPAQEGVEIEP
jgi:phospholipid/cholesterol/gamma-HCH transport system substrate-binding protein